MLKHVDCPYCGEPFETSVDISAGDQHYIEDCPVCCRAQILRVFVERDGSATVRSELE